MLAFITRRFLLLILVLFGVSILIFGILMTFSPERRAATFVTSPQQAKDIPRIIKQFPDCVGAKNHMGSLATTDENVMRIVLEVLKKHDLFFVDSRTSNSTIAYEVAKKMMIPSFKSNLFLDTPDVTLKTMKSKLNTLKSLGKSRDKMLVITHCATQERYEYLKEFIKRIEKLDFEIVPASELFENNLPEIL